MAIRAHWPNVQAGQMADHNPDNLTPRIVSMAEIRQDDRNARRHNPRNVGQIERSIQRDGFGRSGLLSSDNVIAAGNATYEAATAVGMDEAIIVDSDGTRPVYVRRTDLVSGTPQFTEIAIADNRSAELADWDADVLAAFLDDGIDLDQFWFPEELDALLNGNDEPFAGLTDPDDVPAIPDEPITKPGDVWLLGEHRILCGDSGNPQHQQTLLRGDKPRLMVTDPPYGVDYGELVGSRKNQKRGGWADIANDGVSDDELLSLLTVAFAVEGPEVAFVWHPAGARRFVFWDALESNGWRVAQEIVWVKNALVFGRADYQWRHEPCIYAKRKGAPRQDDRTATTVWEVNKPTDSQHPTQKPVELFRIPIANHTESGDIVYDPFLGSGTALLASEELGRRCRGMEMSPAYCDVIVRRWEDFTGNTATRETALHEAAD